MYGHLIMRLDDPPLIDRESKVPLYHQLKEWIVERIESGELDPGSLIPSEMTFCSSLGLSRATVREAINQLVAEGWLYRVRGMGTFVRDGKVEPGMAQKLTSFAEDMQEHHIPYASQLLSARIIPASLALAASLQIAPQAEVVHLERLGSAGGEPLVLADTYLPQDLCRGIVETDLTNCSLYEVLESTYGLTVAKARRTLEPAVATEYEAKILHIMPGAPIHLMRTVSYLASGRPVEHSKLRFRGDRSQFVFTLQRSKTKS